MNYAVQRDCKLLNIRVQKVAGGEGIMPTPLCIPSVDSSREASVLVDCHLNRREILNGTLPCREGQHVQMEVFI